MPVILGVQYSCRLVYNFSSYYTRLHKMEQMSQQVMGKFMNLMTTHVSGQADFMFFLFLCLRTWVQAKCLQFKLPVPCNLIT